jgi:hypothetical protein
MGELPGIGTDQAERVPEGKRRVLFWQTYSQQEVDLVEVRNGDLGLKIFVQQSFKPFQDPLMGIVVGEELAVVKAGYGVA